jgi:hypothetical protein
MNVRKSKNRLAYNLGAGFVIIALSAIVMRIGFPSTSEWLRFIFLISAQLFMAVRAFKLDRLRRTEGRQELIDYWLYHQETPSLLLNSTHFLIYPIRQRFYSDSNRSLVLIVNACSYLSYIFLVLFILVLVFL